MCPGAKRSGSNLLIPLGEHVKRMPLLTTVHFSILNNNLKLPLENRQVPTYNELQERFTPSPGMGILIGIPVCSLSRRL